MADRWMDERDRQWRDRDWRRSEGIGRDYDRDNEDDLYRGDQPGRWREARSWDSEDDDYPDAGRQRRSYGEEEASYRSRSGLTSGGGYGGESYGRGGAGRPQAYQAGSGRVGQGARFTPQDYTGRPGVDPAGRPDYGYSVRPEWSGDEFHRTHRHDMDFERHADDDYEPRRYGGEGRDWRDRRHADDRGRREDRRDEGRREGGGGGASDFLYRAGERIGSWLRGENLMHGSRDEDRDEPRRYRADFGREDRWVVRSGGSRGLGPKGYKRSDERISEEVHERLTDDPWLDASDIHVEVKDGEVTLSGHVDNREAKHRAERLIEDLSGVNHVQNNLRVNPDAGLTSAGRGYGSSALEAEMRRNARANDPGNRGASGLSGRTSTGAEAERSDETSTKRS